MSIPAGKLQHRITIQQDTSTAVDAIGAPVPSWGTFKEVWAEKRETGGGESLYGVQMAADEESVFRIRYTSGVTPLMRVRSASSTRVQSIKRAIDRTGLSEELLLLCGEYV